MAASRAPGSEGTTSSRLATSADAARSVPSGPRYSLPSTSFAAGRVAAGRGVSARLSVSPPGSRPGDVASSLGRAGAWVPSSRSSAALARASSARVAARVTLCGRRRDGPPPGGSPIAIGAVASAAAPPVRGRGALAEASALRLVGFARARVLVRSVTRARGSRTSDGVERSSANDESSPPLGGDGKAPVWRKLAESAEESFFLRLLCVPRTPGSGIDLAVFAGRGRSWTWTRARKLVRRGVKTLKKY